jgi:hypothetical protein
MTPDAIIARVTRALEALRDEDVGYAEQILDDIVWEHWNEKRPPRRLDDEGHPS